MDRTALKTNSSDGQGRRLKAAALAITLTPYTGWALLFLGMNRGANGASCRQRVSARAQRPDNNDVTIVWSRPSKDSNPTDRSLVRIPTHQRDDCTVCRERTCCMNNQNRKLCVYAAMAIAFSLSPLAAYGQTSTSPATNPTMSSQTTVADDRGDRREHHNYGWIGLLGLLGLTGLMRKRHEDRQINYSDRTDTRRSAAGSRS